MKLKIAAALAGLVAMSTPVVVSAEPYAITYTSTVSASGFPEVTVGEGFDVTLVFDNGGSTAAFQTWSPADLRCVVWRFNDARDVVFAQDLEGFVFFTSAGSVSTDGAGVLQTNFTALNALNVTSDYDIVGAGWVGAIDWHTDGFNPAFENPPTAMSAQGGGISMAIGAWSAPTPYVDDCGGLRPLAPPPPVPTMTEWAMILFGLLLAGGAALMAQRRRTA